MAKYAVTVEAWVTIEAPTADEAWQILNNAVSSDLLDTINKLGENADLSVNEPEIEEED